MGRETLGDGTRDVVPEETRDDVKDHEFWKLWTTNLFDVHIFKLDVGSYLCMAPKKALAKVGKGKKDNYLQPCMESGRNFNPLVLYEDGIPGAEAWTAT